MLHVFRGLERPAEIEQVASLVALQERAQLGREHFLDEKRLDRCRASEPSAAHFERPLDVFEIRLVLARLDFDIEPQRRLSVGGRKAVDQLRRGGGRNVVSLPEPAECLAQLVERRPYAFRDRLHEVDVLGVAVGFGEEELV